ncbi:MAG TPA: hypothetical protein VK324_14775 [Tepidisphaeraceae bacterium]|nr:hypothetical protein [Tepidisphaeraceae bacterium]
MLPTFLPGRLALARGTSADYAALARFHYRPGRPATVAGVWAVRYHADVPAGAAGRVVAVGVLSFPTPRSVERERALGLGGMGYGQRLRWLNANVRTISRVIVHPQFRSLGLASAVVRCMLDEGPTTYVEALAHLGRGHPLFEAAGMTRVEPACAARPVYFYRLRGSTDSEAPIRKHQITSIKSQTSTNDQTRK